MTTAILTCETCGQKNRVPLDLPPGKVAICGGCQEPFDAPDPDDEPDEDDPDDVDAD